MSNENREFLFHAQSSRFRHYFVTKKCDETSKSNEYQKRKLFSNSLRISNFFFPQNNSTVWFFLTVVKMKKKNRRNAEFSIPADIELLSFVFEIRVRQKKTGFVKSVRWVRFSDFATWDRLRVATRRIDRGNHSLLILQARDSPSGINKWRIHVARIGKNGRERWRNKKDIKIRVGTRPCVSFRMRNDRWFSLPAGVLFSRQLHTHHYKSVYI